MWPAAGTRRGFPYSLGNLADICQLTLRRCMTYCTRVLHDPYSLKVLWVRARLFHFSFASSSLEACLGEAPCCQWTGRI